MRSENRFLLGLLLVISTSFAFAPNPALSANTATPQKQTLHRADFRIEGASCVTCLRRIAKTFRDSKGVIKADVSVFRPYWSIVIYDSNQTSMPKLSDSIKKENVKFQELEDKPIQSVPLIIIPKGLTQTRSNTSGKDASAGSPAHGH